jgi:superfamily II DNA or RNA helicase
MNDPPLIDRTERQKEAVKKWINSGFRASWMFCTGFGKTRSAIIAIKAFLSKNTDKTITVIVPTDYLKVQWMQELSKNNLLYDVNIEIINSAVKKDTEIDLVILDEVHKYASDTFYDIFTKRKPKLVLGLSATFNRLDGRHDLLNKYCPVCDTITVKEAVANKWLSPYVEYKVIINPDDFDIYKEANRQFNESFSVFDFDFKLAMDCMTNIISRRSYAKKIGITAGEMDAIVFTWGRALKSRKSYVTNHPKKLEITRKILDSRPNCKAITFSATIAQAEKIGKGFVVHSGKTKKKNRITMDDFSKLENGVINTAKSLDEGADIKGLNLAIVLSNSSSSTQKTQRVGRVIRYEEGKEAEIFTLVIRGTMEENWFQNSSAGKSYIEITESELDDILNYRKSENLVQTGKEVQQLFRF